MSNKAPEKLIVKIVDATTGNVLLEHDDIESIIAVMKNETSSHQFQSVSASTTDYVILVKRLIETLEGIREDHPDIYFMAQVLNSKFPKEKT